MKWWLQFLSATVPLTRYFEGLIAEKLQDFMDPERWRVSVTGWMMTDGTACRYDDEVIELWLRAGRRHGWLLATVQ